MNPDMYFKILPIQLFLKSFDTKKRETQLFPAIEGI